jgi:hypothetical protein
MCYMCLRLPRGTNMVAVSRKARLCNLRRAAWRQHGNISPYRDFDEGREVGVCLDVGCPKWAR